jgi:hypothetical protein
VPCSELYRTAAAAALHRHARFHAHRPPISHSRFMLLSKDSKLVSGITLLLIPTIMYGGWTLLGILTHGEATTTPGNLKLNDTQWALWRAGHAHAGVWTMLSLLLQLFLDSTRLPSAMRWLARIAAPIAAVAISGGFFGLALSSCKRPACNDLHLPAHSSRDCVIYDLLCYIWWNIAVFY